MKFHSPSAVRSLPCHLLYSSRSSVRCVNANNVSYYHSLNPQQSSAGPSMTFFQLKDHHSFPVSHSDDSDECALQLAAHSASKSRSSTPKGWCPMVEPVEVMNSLLLECQRARGRETVRRPDDHRHKHRLLNPQHHQRDPKR